MSSAIFISGFSFTECIYLYMTQIYGPSTTLKKPKPWGVKIVNSQSNLKIKGKTTSGSIFFPLKLLNIIYIFNLYIQMMTMCTTVLTGIFMMQFP